MTNSAKTDKPKPAKRRNRVVSLNEAASSALDPLFRKRGFASRDIFAHWAQIVPEPYGQVTMPDKLQWPRRESGAEGAVLHLRCAPGQALAVTHEGARMAQAVNRYFGYFLVASVRLSAEPMPVRQKSAPVAKDCPAPLKAEVGLIVDEVEDAGLRAALRTLGEAVYARRR